MVVVNAACWHWQNEKRTEPPPPSQIASAARSQSGGMTCKKGVGGKKRGKQAIPQKEENSKQEENKQKQATSNKQQARKRNWVIKGERATGCGSSFHGVRKSEVKVGESNRISQLPTTAPNGRPTASHNVSKVPIQRPVKRIRPRHCDIQVSIYQFHTLPRPAGAVVREIGRAGV